MYITMATTFSHAYSTQRRPHTGIIAIPMYINYQLKISLGEGSKRQHHHTVKVLNLNQFMPRTLQCDPVGYIALLDISSFYVCRF